MGSTKIDLKCKDCGQERTLDVSGVTYCDTCDAIAAIGVSEDEN